MIFKIVSILLAFNLCAVSCNLFAGDTNWNDLKVTWGLNPINPNVFQSLPRTEREAINKGWKKEKDCSEVNGVRYLLNGDRAVYLIFNAAGVIAGIASGVPKNLPFNFPSRNIQKYFDDEGDYFVITAYFVDPASVCSKELSNKANTGDRLVIKSRAFTLDVPLNERDVSTFWTQGQCFYTMGVHYWADASGAQIGRNTDADNFSPFFILYNKGKLNSFGWAFNADLNSKRYEHPTASDLPRFFKEVPAFFSDKTKSGTLSTLHIYLDSSPQVNFC